MLHNWILAKVSYEKQLENGMNKKVTESYLVDALSFTEAEARIIQEMTPYVSGEFSVSAVSKSNFSEVFFAEDDLSDSYWFKCKLAFVTVDVRTGTEKKQFTHILVQAADLRDAVKRLDVGMKGPMDDYLIASVVETPIMDVYRYEATPDENPEFEN